MLTLNQCAQVLPTLLKHNIVPYLKGSPALGKSAVVHTLAAQYQLKVIDLRLAQCDPVDLAGFPVFDQQTKKASYFPLDTLPTEGTEIPAGYKGWIIFLDEFSSASLAVQASAYKLVLDRMVGQHKLHPKALLVAAGNREEDNAIVVPMSSALVSRFAIFDVELAHPEWIEWASGHGIDSRISAFLQFRPSNLYTFKPATADKPYASPRTWEMVSKVIKGNPNVTAKTHQAIFQSLLGEAVAVEFLQFLKLQDNIPSVAEIAASPESVAVSEDIATCWAVMGMLVEHINAQNFKPLSKYLDRISAELRVVAMREIRQRHPDLKALPEYNAWIVKTASEVM